MSRVPEPTVAIIEASAACSLKCVGCPLGVGAVRRAGQRMAFEVFTRIVDELASFVKRVYLHNWGEPTTHVDLPRMIDYLKTHTRAELNLATNGNNVPERMVAALVKCDTLSVSVNGLDQETYERYHLGGSAVEAMALMGTLAGLRKDRGMSPLDWTFVAFEHNEHQFDEARQLAEKLGVNLGIKPPFFMPGIDFGEVRPARDPKLRRRPPTQKEMLACKELREVVCVLADGSLVGCCYDSDAQWSPGNVHAEGLLHIWNGEPYRQMRELQARGVVPDMCARVCRMPRVEL